MTVERATIVEVVTMERLWETEPLAAWQVRDQRYEDSKRSPLVSIPVLEVPNVSGLNVEPAKITNPTGRHRNRVWQYFMALRFSASTEFSVRKDWPQMNTDEHGSQPAICVHPCSSVALFL